jgi:hypothetical protein
MDPLARQLCFVFVCKWVVRPQVNKQQSVPSKAASKAAGDWHKVHGMDGACWQVGTAISTEEANE